MTMAAAMGMAAAMTMAAAMARAGLKLQPRQDPPPRPLPTLPRRLQPVYRLDQDVRRRLSPPSCVALGFRKTPAAPASRPPLQALASTSRQARMVPALMGGEAHAVPALEVPKARMLPRQAQVVLLAVARLQRASEARHHRPMRGRERGRSMRRRLVAPQTQRWGVRESHDFDLVMRVVVRVVIV